MDRQYQSAVFFNDAFILQDTNYKYWTGIKVLNFTIIQLPPLWPNIHMLQKIYTVSANILHSYIS